MKRMVCLFLMLVILPTASHAIAWRDDVKSVEVKPTGEMKQVGKVHYSPLRIFGGSCVALGGKWVLTSRHGTEKWPASILKVKFPGLGEGEYAVKRVLFPPKGDFGLMELNKEVKGAKQLSLFQGDVKADQLAWIGGFGMAGPVGKVAGSGKFHMGHNRVDRLRRGNISISLSKPTDKKAEKDEAILTLFDSGSPLFLKTKDRWQLAGIGATASNTMNPQYGDSAGYAPVSAIATWLKSTMK